MFQVTTTKRHALLSVRVEAPKMLAVPAQDCIGGHRRWQRGRRWTIAVARRCYPIVSIPAFLVVALFVSAALILTVVGLTIAAALRLPNRIANALILHASRRIHPRQSLS
jgi:hypothetical protein